MDYLFSRGANKDPGDPAAAVEIENDAAVDRAGDIRVVTEPFPFRIVFCLRAF